MKGFLLAATAMVVISSGPAMAQGVNPDHVNVLGTRMSGPLGFFGAPIGGTPAQRAAAAHRAEAARATEAAGPRLSIFGAQVHGPVGFFGTPIGQAGTARGGGLPPG